MCCEKSINFWQAVLTAKTDCTDFLCLRPNDMELTAMTSV